MKKYTKCVIVKNSGLFDERLVRPAVAARAVRRVLELSAFSRLDRGRSQ